MTARARLRTAALLVLRDPLVLGETLVVPLLQPLVADRADKSEVQDVVAGRGLAEARHPTIGHETDRIGRRIRDRVAHRVPRQNDLYEIENVIEKPTPSEAEQKLIVPGLRAGYYLCFFGIHVLTPAVMTM